VVEIIFYIGCRSTGFDAGRAAAYTAITGDHLTLFDIKRVAFDHFPFMEAALAQSFAAVLVTGFGFLEGDDIAHCLVPVIIPVSIMTVNGYVCQLCRSIKMTTDTHRVLVGSVGWQHLAWQDSYYPEDLPPDWRLGFYANEFALAVITELEQEFSEDLFAEIEECNDRLSVMIQLKLVPSPADAGQQLRDAGEFATRLGQRCAGILVQLDPAAFGDPAVLLSLLAEVPTDIPLCLDPVGTALSPALREQLRDKDIGWSWNNDSDSDGLAIGRLGVITVQGDQPPTALRERVETALKYSSDEHRMALVFAGDPPSVEQMRQAKTIEELL